MCLDLYPLDCCNLFTSFLKTANWIENIPGMTNQHIFTMCSSTNQGLFVISTSNLTETWQSTSSDLIISLCFRVKTQSKDFKYFIMCSIETQLESIIASICYNTLIIKNYRQKVLSCVFHELLPYTREVTIDFFYTFSLLPL